MRLARVCYSYPPTNSEGRWEGDRVGRRSLGVSTYVRWGTMSLCGEDDVARGFQRTATDTVALPREAYHRCDFGSC